MPTVGSQVPTHHSILEPHGKHEVARPQATPAPAHRAEVRCPQRQTDPALSALLPFGHYLVTFLAYQRFSNNVELQKE